MTVVELPAMGPAAIQNARLTYKCWATDSADRCSEWTTDPLLCREDVSDDPNHVGLCPRHLDKYRRECA